MATYRLSDAVILARRTAQARTILEVNMEPDQEYTVAEILALLGKHGLHLSNPDYVEVGQVLLDDNTLTAV